MFWLLAPEFHRGRRVRSTHGARLLRAAQNALHLSGRLGRRANFRRNIGIARAGSAVVVDVARCA